MDYWHNRKECIPAFDFQDPGIFKVWLRQSSTHCAICEAQELPICVFLRPGSEELALTSTLTCMRSSQNEQLRLNRLGGAVVLRV